MAQRSVIEMFERDPAGTHLYNRLLAEAAIKDRTVTACGQRVELKRGQLVFGRVKWADKTGISQDVIRRIMRNLMDEGEITQLNKGKFSIVSIFSIMNAPAGPQPDTSAPPVVHHSKNKEYLIQENNSKQCITDASDEKEGPNRFEWQEGMTIPKDWPHHDDPDVICWFEDMALNDPTTGGRPMGSWRGMWLARLTTLGLYTPTRCEF